MDTSPCFSATFTKGNNLSVFLFASLVEEILKMVYTFTLLHSEQPKLYGVLAVLSATGLKGEYALKGAQFFLLETYDPYGKGRQKFDCRIASPESHNTNSS